MYCVKMFVVYGTPCCTEWAELPERAQVGGCWGYGTYTEVQAWRVLHCKGKESAEWAELPEGVHVGGLLRVYACLICAGFLSYMTHVEGVECSLAHIWFLEGICFQTLPVWHGLLRGCCPTVSLLLMMLFSPAAWSVWGPSAANP
jgi:hypothetical protein